MGTLSFEPLISFWLWLTLAAAGLGLLISYGLCKPANLSRIRWSIFLILMTCNLILVLVILLNPTWIEPVPPPPGKPMLTILVDGSSSMSTRDGDAEFTRYQSAARLAKTVVKETERDFETRIKLFSKRTKLMEAGRLEDQTPNGQATDLAAALQENLQTHRPQGQAILLISDGIHNDSGGIMPVLHAAKNAKAVSCPIFTRTIGGDKVVTDVAVELRAMRELAFIRQTIPVRVHLRGQGAAGRQTTLTLSYNGEDVAKKTIKFSKEEEIIDASFEIMQEKAGLYRYEVRATGVPGEMSLINNTSPLLLRVVEDPIRILVLEGKPYWDNKFLLRTLSQDISVELNSLVRVSDKRYFQRTWQRESQKAPKQKTNVHQSWKVLEDLPKYLSSDKGLRTYQVVVLGRDVDVFLTVPVLEQLREWVGRDGGCLVCYRGRPVAQVSQKLAPLLPVHWVPTREARFLPQLTPQGQDLNWFSSLLTGKGDVFFGLPSLATVARPVRPKPLAVVLATSKDLAGNEQTPVVSYQSYGAGRVVTLEGSGMWRWAFLPPQQKKRDDVYRSLWHSLVRWLVSGAILRPGQKLALHSDKSVFSVSESATATLLVREELASGTIPDVELLSPNLPNKPKKFRPVPAGEAMGVYRLHFGKLPEGNYVARVTGSQSAGSGESTAFDVRSLFDEQLDLKARPDLMARIANESGGKALAETLPDAVAAQIQQNLSKSRPAHVRRLIAWDRWYVLVGILAVWAITWVVRRWGGLV